MQLISKVASPNKVSEYRPIACCNVIYKLITKVMTNRMQSVLGEVISLTRRSFPNALFCPTSLFVRNWCVATMGLMWLHVA